MRRDDAGPYALETLAALPVPPLFSTDPRALVARYVAFFEGESGRKLYPAQVEMLMIETLAYAMAMLGEEAQAVAEQHLVAFASEAGLSVLGPNRSTPRLPAARATTTLRFSVAQALPESLLIPEGARVSGGAGGMVFLTLAPAIIAAGSLHVDVTAGAETAGVAGNDYLPGQLTSMLDPRPFVAVSNTEASAGGADIEPLALWRLRVANAYDRISAAGGKGWYREEAMAASPAIVDVAVVRPQPCYIDIYPLTADGAAEPALRSAVKAHLSTVRALESRFGDEVTVLAPVAVPAAPTLTVRVRGATAGVAAAAEAAARSILSIWTQRLGATVAPSDVEGAVRIALPLAADVEIAGLSFQQLQPQQFLDLTDLTIVVEPLDG